MGAHQPMVHLPKNKVRNNMGLKADSVSCVAFILMYEFVEQMTQLSALPKFVTK